MRKIYFFLSSGFGAWSYKPLWIIFALVCIVYIGGCAPKTLYYWGDYEDCLYTINLKSDPEKSFSILSEIVTKAEKEKGVKLAPGLYAEYGFMLYQKGRTDDAAYYFKKESEAFPESKFLMDKLIARIEKPGTNNADDQPVAEANPIATSESEVETLGGER